MYTHEEIRNVYAVLIGKSKRRDHLDNLEVLGRQ
jgi:hypothetical protein